MKEPVVEIKNLKKYYGKQRGIEDVSFSVHEGEIFGFIGPNGAGKSTTIRTLLALLKPTSGSATIFGKDCIAHASDIAKDVGYLSGEPSYYENMKAKEFLKYSAELYGKKDNSRLDELSERLQLDMSRKIEDLSMGNKKKVGIISALLHSPKLLILDEPTSGLDPLMQQIFFDILREENEKGTTILFSSHVLSEVQKLCDKVAIIKEGVIIDTQSITELRKNGYKKVSIFADSAISEEDFMMDGVADLAIRDNSASFIYMGPVTDLLQRINSFKVRDVFIEEPTLEEIFLHYYQ
ncbi:ABC transporter ATP-binding protein [Gudongella sp. DL1XJH-153]|uniref:ABC transporter ATP-binding protein n=1 Tax=Gudongella sp. DL1XJH-153 TaxID=3409804 RepID=UPI003BB78E5D